MKLLIQISYRDITEEWCLHHESPARVRDAVFGMLYASGVGSNEINYVNVSKVKQSNEPQQSS
jgi:hypothetical protein